MIRWLLLVPANLVMWVVGYILAPVLPLFCGSDGKLPSWLYWFTTWDQEELFFTPEWVHEKWPYLENIKPEWLKLYLCRVAWLIRNTSYGFAYSVSGYYYQSQDIKWVTKWWSPENGVENKTIAYDTNSNPWLWGAFRLSMFKRYWPSCKYGIRIYIGWKISETDQGRCHCMMAMHINPFRTT